LWATPVPGRLDSDRGLRDARDHAITGGQEKESVFRFS
jgi:hypothetical protein